jgi:chemotaxis protein methyltransferase CheR
MTPPQDAPRAETRAFDPILRFVSGRSGLSFANRRDGAELGISRAMGRAKIADLSRYLERLTADEDTLNDLLAELTIGETYFFREPAQFQFLRRVVLPDLVRLRGAGHTLRVWSAGCATGEEAYSLAILFEEEGLADASSLLATDLSRPALARARQGVYRGWSLRGDGAASALPYLDPVGDAFQIKDRLRRRVTFAALNLAEDTYPTPVAGVGEMDLILCRNVLLYFEAETVRQVAQRLLASLAAGGWLITSSADPPLAPETPFETVVADEGVFYRRLDTLPVEMPAASEPRVPDEGRPGLQPGAGGSGPLKEANDAGSPLQGASQPSPAVNGRAEEVRALAGSSPAEAERLCAEALRHNPLSVELSYLRGLLLLDLGRDEEAVWMLRRVLYLDHGLAVAHFALGSALLRRGDRDGARRAYRNACDLCAACPPEQPVPLADGACAGPLADAAAAQLARLDAPGGTP